MNKMAVTRKLRFLYLTGVSFLFPVVALAHYGNGLLHFHDGFIHPLTGWDHILVALAVGVWATATENRIRLSVPSIFVISMTMGVLVGMAGVRIPFLEQGILLSIAILGWLLLSERVPSGWTLLAVCCFGAIHGNAHGIEVPMAARGAVIGGISGLIAATVLLHLLGIVLVVAMRKTMRESVGRKLIQSFGVGLISVALIAIGIGV